MKEMLNGLGNLVAGLGLLLCLVGGVWRLMGNYYLMNFQIITLFSVGVSLVIVALLFKVETLIRRS